MASNRSIDEIVSGHNLPVEVVSNFNNIVVVVNHNYSLKGVLLPVNDENKDRLERFLNDYQKSDCRIDRDRRKTDKESLVCVPDSTLSHTTADSVQNKRAAGHHDDRCLECKRTIKKPTKKRSSVSREIERLTNHGFNECLLKKKNISRRASIKPDDLPNGASSKRPDKVARKPRIKSEKRRQPIKHDCPPEPQTASPIASPPVIDESPVIRRQTKARALKTRANEKIIDLCSPRSHKARKSEPVDTTPPIDRLHSPTSNNNRKKSKKNLINENTDDDDDDDDDEDSPIKLSDVSIYDFVGDEDCESEPNRVLYSGKSTGGNKSYFLDKSSNRSRVDKRGYQRKTSDKSSNKINTINSNNNNKKINNDNNNNYNQNGSNNNNVSCRDDEIHSDPGIVSAEYKGARFSINNIVWAKIPGYPFWPAHIKSFDNVSASKSQGKRCRINWIGWNQKSFLPLKSLLHFKDHFPVKYSAKFKSQKYKTAIELACRELGLDLGELVANAAALGNGNTGSSSPPPTAAAVRAERQNAVFGKRNRAIDLDRIFSAKGGGGAGFEMGLGAANASYSDEDTDEEEKARGALITAESLEAANRSSSKQPNFDF